MHECYTVTVRGSRRVEYSGGRSGDRGRDRWRVRYDTAVRSPGRGLREGFRLRESLLEEVGEAWVEDLQVLGTGDAVPLVLEGEEVVGDAEFLEGSRGDGGVIWGVVGVFEALNDKKV